VTLVSFVTKALTHRSLVTFNSDLEFGVQTFYLVFPDKDSLPLSALQIQKIVPGNRTRL
jgi:hypothetical protein